MNYTVVQHDGKWAVASNGVKIFIDLDHDTATSWARKFQMEADAQERENAEG